MDLIASGREMLKQVLEDGFFTEIYTPETS